MENQELGFSRISSEHKVALDSVLPDRPLCPDDIRHFLGKLHGPASTLIIIDELDKLHDTSARTSLAETIKNLSDHAVKATIILVGVADSVEELIREHHSIERNIVQVPMPRMSQGELMAILNGFDNAGMTASERVKIWITKLSQGLPHYAHFLGLHAAYTALENGRTEVTPDDVLASTEKIVSKSYTMASAYNKATHSSQKQNLYAKVLSACALAETDELGYFTATAVRGPMSDIMGKPYDVPYFSRHLSDFCEEKRGPILRKIGEPWRTRYRFLDAMMQPFVIIHDYSVGLLTNTLLDDSRGRLVESPVSNGSINPTGDAS
jgi:hypothetical protein